MPGALSTWKRLCTDRSGLVSYEYVIVTAVMVAATAAAYSTDAAISIAAVLTGAIGTITAAVTAFVGGS